jgi:hypothetical protein
MRIHRAACIRNANDRFALYALDASNDQRRAGPCGGYRRPARCSGVDNELKSIACEQCAILRTDDPLNAASIPTTGCIIQQDRSAKPHSGFYYPGALRGSKTVGDIRCVNLRGSAFRHAVARAAETQAEEPQTHTHP